MCLCVLTSLDLRDRRSSVSMSVTSALKSSAVFMASTWWPRNRQIQTLDFGWIANGYWNELHSSTPGLLVRFSAIIQHPEAVIQFQHSYLQMQNTWCLETINILLSADQTKSAENQASLYLVSIRCVPPEKLEPGLQHFKILHYLQQGLESLTNESRCDYQMQYMKENHLKKENRLAWSSTVSLVSSHLRLKKYSFFSAWRDHLTICCMLKTKTEAALAFFT